MTLITFMQHLTNGISLGSLYALIAIGYTMVYGILKLINFAHGDIFMMAAYFAFFGVTTFNLPWYFAFIIAIAITAVIGMTIEFTSYRPLRNAPKISILISAIGVSFLLENLAVVLFGGRPKAFPTPKIFTDVVVIGGVSIQNLTFIIPIVTVILLFALLHLVNKTNVGMAMRAVSKDVEIASLMGIKVNRIISFTFAIGSMLAAVGAIMWSSKYPQIVPLMGMIPGLKCFIAAVIGGIGDIKGAVIGGFILGIGEIMLVAFLPTLTGYRDAFAFVLLIVILLFKPTGIMGKNLTEKV
ncbi:branched-chain amino acid ABC transporter permease [Clostridium gasigenes]|uniref:branched-chain amino acid ABC transporter permease n=1 Tax=Clostridium gasigenes TaxID=94869 RepID=UPI00143854D7|nr:branched-chain amino acid ABC transporter permease [Clostridium gasigenes]MBU3105454.1 branched-chain amino acid ABC transporter permease [Clostridium gasigenes]MBU3106911.1 branched-chain amino acid ABC transporter permease [Clostridium gasigenes]MBU3131853.1 branched-chain amino acid ABC transporter permease [Clostridium gasigenes]NKF05618.1 branched-chain amino acid ABC transporter permease [Clostridium gasigenes]QSW19057.1 branched-chain amino acid ABC transporter permease [Clostridium 